MQPLFLGDEKLADLIIIIKEVSVYHVGSTFAMLLLSFPLGVGREDILVMWSFFHPLSF